MGKRASVLSLSPSHLVEIDRCVVAAAAAESGADGGLRGSPPLRPRTHHSTQNPHARIGMS